MIHTDGTPTIANGRATRPLAVQQRDYLRSMDGPPAAQVRFPHGPRFPVDPNYHRAAPGPRPDPAAPVGHGDPLTKAGR